MAKIEETSEVKPIEGIIPKKISKVKRAWTKAGKLFYSKKQWAKKKETYNRYLRSGKWKEKRRKILKRCGAEPGSSRGFCERCGKKRSLEVHHLTYDRVFKEKPEDLMGVCRPCHRILDEERRIQKRLEMVS